MDEELLLHPFLHLAYVGPEMGSVLVGDQVEGVACHVVEVEACEEGEGHHKMALEEV